VLRYFESREAVLLELLDREFGGWLDGIGQALEASPSPGAVPASQVDRLASVMARAARERPLFCELLSNAATVLEHNVSGEVAAAYKRGALAHAARLMDLVARVLPLGGADATVRVAGAVSLGVGGLWGMCRPSPGMEAAYLEHPELAVFRIDFEAALREYLEVLLTGLVSLRGRTEP
ncbi:MAG: hypothetical protein LBL01_06380, partial [Bifidobacteriaceae bacterium]|jgi:AcrR family transcriptional regulator|nr:hypothetical protein [Bifidobacteriaceae bacterium]